MVLSQKTQLERNQMTLSFLFLIGLVFSVLDNLSKTHVMQIGNFVGGKARSFTCNYI